MSRNPALDPIDLFEGVRDQEELYMAMLRASPCFFGAEVLGLKIGPHMLEWEDMILRHTKVALTAARGHSKSTFMSYLYPIWRAWREPGCEVYIFSNTIEQSQEFLDIILNGRNNLKAITDIALLAHMVPLRSAGVARRNRRDVRFTNGSRIKALGYGKSIRGAHPKYVVLDDVLNDEDMYSQTVREKHVMYYQSAIRPMPPRDGQIVSVGTPFHVEDLHGWFSKNKMFRFASYPAIVKDEHGEDQALDPNQFTLEEIKDIKAEVSSIAFAREYLVQPISDDVAIFPSWLFPPLYDKTLCLKPTKEWIRANGLSVFIGVDIALSASVGADYFVIFAIGRDRNGNYYILDIERHKGLPFNMQLGRIHAVANRYQTDLIMIESNQMQKVWSEELIRTSDLPVKAFETRAQNKYPLDRGLPGIRVLLENQKLVIPRGDDHSVEMTDIWIQEMTQIGFVDGKLQGVGAHDDTAMALWIATEAAKAGGFSFGFGSDDEEEAAAEFLGGGEDDLDWQREMLGDDGDTDDSAFAI